MTSETTSGVARPRICVWWGIPCKAMSGVFRELAGLDCSVQVNLLDPMSENRVRLGWEMPDYGEAVPVFLPGEASARAIFLRDFPYRSFDVHLLNGFYRSPELVGVVSRLRRASIPYGVMTEAPFNEHFGALRAMKYAYLALVVPIIGRKVAASAAFTCCLSGAGAKSFEWLRLFGFPPSGIHPYGYFSEEPALDLATAGEIRETPLLVCTGYLTKNKGHALLLPALCRLKSEGFKFRCLITGFGPKERSLRAYIAEHGLGDRVELTGVVPAAKLNELLARADVFVAPGFEEPWAIRINEALQSACAVVLSDKIGAAELVRTSGAGLVFESGSSESLAESLRAMLANPRLLREMKERALRYRHRIHPREAARYLLRIIRHHCGDGPAPGTPPWLEVSAETGGVR